MITIETTACCQAEIPQACLDAQCHHGQAVMWNTEDMRWEMPPTGPCQAYRKLGAGTFHTAC